MYSTHPTVGLMPTQSQLSRDAAERYAIHVALRERRRRRRRSTARTARRTTVKGGSDE
jgi:hypothetical protein